MPRARAVAAVALSSWTLGLGSVLSFNRWADWRPFAAIPAFADKNLWASDFFAANILAPPGAIGISLFIGWRVRQHVPAEETAAMSPFASRIVFALLRWVCPVLVAVVMITSLA